jgi:hypothetical protein
MVERGMYLRQLGLDKKTSKLHFCLTKIDFVSDEDLTPFIKDAGSKPIYNYEGSRSIQAVAWLVPDIECCRTFRRVRRTRNSGSTMTQGEKSPAWANNPIQKSVF